MTDWTEPDRTPRGLEARRKSRRLGVRRLVGQDRRLASPSWALVRGVCTVLSEVLRRERPGKRIDALRVDRDKNARKTDGVLPTEKKENRPAIPSGLIGYNEGKWREKGGTSWWCCLRWNRPNNRGSWGSHFLIVRSGISGAVQVPAHTNYYVPVLAATDSRAGGTAQIILSIFFFS